MRKASEDNEDGSRYKVHNIGNNKLESLRYFVDTLEKCPLAEGIINKPLKKNIFLCNPETFIRHMRMSMIIRNFGF